MQIDLIIDFQRSTMCQALAIKIQAVDFALQESAYILRLLPEGKGSFEVVPGRLAARGRWVAGLEGRLRESWVDSLSLTDY